MPHKRGIDDEASETLASASGKNIEGLLKRANKRRNAADASTTLAGAARILPRLPPRQAAASALCGAPAASAKDKQQKPFEEIPHTVGISSIPEEAPVKVDRHKTKHLPLAVTPAAGVDEERPLSDGGGGVSDGDWEDISDLDENPDGNFSPSSGAAAAAAAAASGGITVAIKNGASGSADPSRRRQAFTKEDREIARLVHRSHLLCLLGRGILYDIAANDPLAQSLLLSLIPKDVAEKILTDLKSTDMDAHVSALSLAVDWFRVNFKLLKNSAAQPPVQGSDDIDDAIERAKGVSGIVEQLLVVIEKQFGIAEELVTVFAAALRSLGCLVRTVRVLEPSSLKPGDALRQQENALKNFMKLPTRQQRREEKGGAVSLVASAATELLYGTESQRQQTIREHVAASLGISDIRAIKVTPGKGNTGPSIFLDGSRIKRSRKQNNSHNKKKGAAPGECHAGAKEGGPRVAIGSLAKEADTALVDGPTLDEEEGAVERGEVKTQKGRGGRRHGAKTKEESGGDQRKNAAMDTSKKVERKRKSADSIIDLTGSSDGEGLVDGRDKGAKEDVGGGGFCDGGVPLQQVEEKKGGIRQQQRKRKGDAEFERELEVALAATAFETGKDDGKISSAPAAADGATEGSKRLSRGGGGANGATRGAAFGAHQGHVGRYWIEVYCGSTTSGRWVHVCPISGWVDRAEDVEGLAPRGQSLAYVIAFGGNGGAKDVTRRYASSFVSAEKQREGEWWDATLRPLRSKEIAVLHHAAAAAAGTGENHVAAVTTAKRLSYGDTNGGNTDTAAANMPASNAVDAQLPCSPSTKRPGPPAGVVAVAREDLELEQRAAAERRGLPTTIDGFKTHATLILARHIGKHQTLRPGSKPMGVHKGEAYYLRDHVGDIHTAERWRRMGREVLTNELDTPVKKLKKRLPPAGRGGRGPGTRFLGAAFGGQGSGGSGRAASESEDAEEGNDAEMSMFYGIWQTKVWEPPAARGGKIPRNERGNVEVPPFAAALPKGTVHIQLPFVGPICRKLGIDFAPALTGFDIRAGRSVPSIEGVVICAEHEAALRAAYERDMAQRAQQAKAKRLAEAEKTWRELLRALLTRIRLSRSYSGGGRGQPDTAEREAAAMLVHDQTREKLQAETGKASSGPGRRVKEKDGTANVDEEEGFAAAGVKIEEI